MANVTETLALGTAGLSTPYGVAGRAGPPSLDSARALIASSYESGVRFFDTAQAYGDSERTLGMCIEELGIAGEVCVITKLDPGLRDADAEAIRQAALASRELCGAGELWGLMLHREELLDAWEAKWGPILMGLKRDGVAKHVGVSLYSPAAALRALELDGLDIIQVPANVFDRRMLRHGVFTTAREAGKTVFVRSVYLQGLVGLEPELVPASIAGASGAASAYVSFCASNSLEPRQFAIDYALSMAPDSILVIGADDAAQVRENAALCRRANAARDARAAWDEAWPDDIETLIDPTRWPPPQARAGEDGDH